MLTGVGLKLKDKRVDRILTSKGFVGADIYYSPISSWLVFLTLLLSTCSFLIYFIFSSFYGLLAIPYLGISYLLNAYHNTSFALYKDQLIAVNPNIPFSKTTIIETRDIELITIAGKRAKWKGYFLEFGENFMEIKTGKGKHTFYCSALELDSFDENWTEKTLDDLNSALIRKGIITDLIL